MILAVCICGIVFVVIGGLMLAHSENSSPPTGYLSTTPREAVFLEFTTSHSSLSGSAHVARLSSSGAHVAAATGSIGGTISGNTVTITDGSAVLTSSGGNISGAMRGSNLVLEFLGSGGRLESVTFTHTSVSDYDAAVSKLQKEANRSATIQDANEAQARKRQVITDATRSVLGDEGSISGGITSMAGAEQGLGSYVSLAASNLQNARGDLSMEQGDTSFGSSVTCSKVGLVMADEGSLSATLGDYQDALSSDQSVASGVQENVASLRADWTSLTEAEKADPTYTPSGGLPSLSGETSAISVSSSALTKYQQVTAADTETINNYLTQAKGYVAQANQLCNSTGG